MTVETSPVSVAAGRTDSLSSSSSSRIEPPGSPLRLLPRAMRDWVDSSSFFRNYTRSWARRNILRNHRSFSDHPLPSSQWKARRLSTFRRPAGHKPKVTKHVIDISPNDEHDTLVTKVTAGLYRVMPSRKLMPGGLVEITRLSGALTNSVYKVTVTYPVVDSDGASSISESDQQEPPPPPPPQQLLLRIYGIGVDQLFEREKELYWLARLSELGIGPRMLAVFENGRVEEYLESTTLTRTDIRDPATSRHIAKRMCELHSIVNTFKPRPGCVPEVWVCIDKWYGTVSRKWAALESRLVKHGKPVDQLHIHKLGEDLDYLKARITAINSPIVFGHNDLQYGNILRLSDGSDELVVIDFEYAGYNYRGYDIANHFCEWAADYHSSAPHALDYTAYPTEEEQTRFLNAYIDEQIKLDPKKCPPEFLNDRAQALTSLLLEVACFRTASHLLWGLWGLLQASESDIDFDYFEYARQRLVAFREELYKEQRD